MYRLVFVIFLQFLICLFGCEKLIRDNPRDPGSSTYSKPHISAMPDTSIAIKNEIQLWVKTNSSAEDIDYYLWSFDNCATFDTSLDGTLNKAFGTEKLGLNSIIVYAVNIHQVQSKPDTIILKVTNGAIPVINSSTSVTAKVGQGISFFVSGTDIDGEIVNYYWSVGDYFSDTTKSNRFYFTFNSIGIHTVMVRAKDNSGNFSEPVNISINVSNGQIPVVSSSTPISTKKGSWISFFVNGSDPDGEIIYYYLAVDGENYSDSTRSNRFTQTFNETGTFNLLVRAKDNDGNLSNPFKIVVYVKE